MLGTKKHRNLVLILILILLSNIGSACVTSEKKKKDFREFIPSGYLEGNIVAVDGKDKNPILTNVNMFPMDVQYKQGVGIIDIGNKTYKFNWESDSVLDANTWNISFSKDNNIYANLNENFNFVGVLNQTDIGLNLKGTLTIKNEIEGEKIPYYLEAYKNEKPEIILKGEGLTATAEEGLTLTVTHTGLETEEIKIFMDSISTEDTYELSTESIKKEKNGNSTLITSIIKKDFAKGDYSLYLVRSEKFQRNKIKVTI